ncbi:MAG: glycerol-3-phosphate dehydrogenase [Acidobacteria bacterium]|nr:MAG: glycerol-3-phosphate dehydrogenase [Acidobacteriota bacterium]TLZ45119.1 MAG: NAD(P)-dependent glycerol-3-phosphate dehydrogenase [Gammaproteobacteria bacterium]
MITVLGAGGWGTALAVHLVRTGHDAWLWGRDAALIAELSARRANAVYLPDITFPPKLKVTADLMEALRNAEVIVVAVPSHGMRDVLRRAAPLVQRDAMVVSAAKGLERDSLFRPSEIVQQELGRDARVGVLSGPSFASEMARELPTAVCIASTDSRLVDKVQADFRAPYFRLYGTTDVIGVEIGGALKNVIAIAAGVGEGLGLGHNAQAGLITRGLAEIARLACAAGAQRDTLAGLTGLGDLVLTCTGRLSRNRHVGLELARGRALPDVLASMKMVAEGVRTTDAALALAKRHGVELPIAAQVAELLAGRKDARTALYDLMLRPQKAEAG